MLPERNSLAEAKNIYGHCVSVPREVDEKNYGTARGKQTFKLIELSNKTELSTQIFVRLNFKF